MKLPILIWAASLCGLVQSDFDEFEDKVSILIKKLKDTKYLMSETESSLLKERLAKFDRVFTKNNNDSAASSQSLSVDPGSDLYRSWS